MFCQLGMDTPFSPRRTGTTRQPRRVYARAAISIGESLPSPCPPPITSPFPFPLPLIATNLLYTASTPAPHGKAHEKTAPHHPARTPVPRAHTRDSLAPYSGSPCTERISVRRSVEQIF